MSSAGALAGSGGLSEWRRALGNRIETEHGGRITARCPAHDDHRASLSVTEGDNGRVLAHCFVGCAFGAIRDALGIATVGAAEGGAGILATYDYRTADGTLLYQKVRKAGKEFSQRQPDGSGWKWGLKGIDARPLYRLPQLARAIADGQRIYVVEGEKDADALAVLGLAATCNSDGASKDTQRPKWGARESEQLQGASEVVVLPDNDDPGRAHGRAIVAGLAALDPAPLVRVLALPGLPEKGDVSDWLGDGGTVEALGALASVAPVGGGAKSPPRDGATLAAEVFDTIRRYVVLSDEAARALALWVLHTHALDATESFTPYIQITSPTRESGKTTLIDVLEALVPNPLRADSASAAAIYRAVDRGRGRGEPTGAPPTLFLDELDAVFGGSGSKSDKAEALRGVLNSGFKRDGRTLVCDGDQHEPRAFVTFCPKVLAGIGQLPDTISSRSIPVPLSRATREEIARLQPARARALARLSGLCEEVSAWASAAVPRLKARDEPVLGLKARHDDVWGPLLNIADDCGGEWPSLARASARLLHADTGDSTDGRDAGIALLADLRDIFNLEGVPFIASARLAERLRLMEDRPWPEYSRGGPISTHAMARLLKPFGIGPRQERIGTGTVRAYFLGDCEEPFRRYLPTPPALSGTSGTGRDSPSEKGCSTSPEAERARTDPQPGRGTAWTPAVPLVPVVPLPPGGVPLTAMGYPASWG